MIVDDRVDGDELVKMVELLDMVMVLVEIVALLGMMMVELVEIVELLDMVMMELVKIVKLLDMMMIECKRLLNYWIL